MTQRNSFHYNSSHSTRKLSSNIKFNKQRAWKNYCTKPEHKKLKKAFREYKFCCLIPADGHCESKSMLLVYFILVEHLSLSALAAPAPSSATKLSQRKLFNLAVFLSVVSVEINGNGEKPPKNVIKSRTNGIEARSVAIWLFGYKTHPFCTGNKATTKTGMMMIQIRNPFFHINTDEWRATSNDGMCRT